MRSRYNEDEYKAYREAFVEGYQTDFAVRDLDLLEKSFHLFEGLSMMQFYAHSPLLDPNKHHFEENKEYLLK